MADSLNYDDYNDDAGLEPADKIANGSNREDWLKMTKGQVLLGAFLYFHPVDVRAVAIAREQAKEAKKTLTPEEIKAIAHKALSDRAQALTQRAFAERAKELQKKVEELTAEEKQGLVKTIDQITPDERLDTSTVQFKRMKAHYQQGFGFALSRLGKDGAEADAIWKKLPEPKLYYTTLLLLYPMTAAGKHDIEAIRRKEYQIKPWRFGQGTYDEIYNLNDGLRGNQMSIATQDIKLECMDTQYQNTKVSFVGKAIWQGSAGFRKLVLSEAVKKYDKLIPFKDMSTEALRAKLGLGGSSVQDVSSADDFTGLLDTV